MKRLEYRVTATGIAEQTVEVRWADQLLAEREGARHGITKDLPLHLTTYWVWAALKRTGAGVPSYQDFQQDPELDIEPVEAAGDVPPTEPAQAG